jgi:GrpB-like predicted nucleotidyltransferase (UPF0157 family)
MTPGGAFYPSVSVQSSMKLVNSDDIAGYTNQLFEHWTSKIIEIIPGAEIEHIGSTAVSNSMTKGDVDLYVGVQANQFKAAIRSLRSIGFINKPEHFQDDKLCMLVNDEVPDIALQVVSKGSKYEFFLIFRDLLRNDRELNHAYSQLKLDSIECNPEEYRQKKAIFIEAVLARHSN